MSELYTSVLISQENMLYTGEIYTASKKIYTPASSDGRDKCHLWWSEEELDVFR